MRFHGLMAVRDEDDILPQCLAHLLTWIDGLYVLDLGSKDSTWQIVRDAAANDRRVVPFESRPYQYEDSIRWYLFEKFRSRFQDGDWIVKIDGDEFYEVTPPKFVAERVRDGESMVYLGWYFFRLTSKEVADYESGRVQVSEDRKRPIEQRRRYFKIPDYGEPRMFRYRHSMKWPSTRMHPYNAGYIARERIPIRHYPHRDPEQMAKRYRLRAAMLEMQGQVGPPQWRLKDWHREVLQLDEATGAAIEQTQPSEGLSSAQGHTAGELHYWQPGTELPAITGTPQLSRWQRRAVQRLIYPDLVRLMDAWRPTGQPDSTPKPIPADVQARL